MTFYTTKNLLDECSKTRWAKFKIKNRSERMDVVSDIFDSLDGWVNDRMQKLKGARIPNFGTFTWRNRTSAVTGSTTHIKPMFVPDETFVKNFALSPELGSTLRLGDTQKNLGRVEEINYTRLAIKYSESLTKDLIFSGSRDMISHIGRACGTRDKVSIEFSFGKLVCKRRKLKFKFAAELLLKGNPNMAETMGGMSSTILSIADDAEVQALLDEEDNRNRRVDAEEERKVELEQEQEEKQGEFGRAPIPQLNLATSGPATDYESKVDDEGWEDIEAPEMTQNLLFTTSGLQTQPRSNPVIRERAQSVLSDAFQRHVEVVNELIDEDDRAEEELRDRLSEADREEALKKKRQEETRKLIQSEILEQIKVHSEEKEREQKEGKTAKMDLYPPLASFDIGLEERLIKSGSLPNLTDRIKRDPIMMMKIAKKIKMKEKAEKLGSFLKGQVREREENESDAHRKQLESEREFLHHLDDQTMKHRRWNRMQKRKQQKELSTAWERDRQIRSYLRSRDEARRRGQTPAARPPAMLRSLGIGQKARSKDQQQEQPRSEEEQRRGKEQAQLQKSSSSTSFAASVTSDLDIGVGFDMRA